MNKKEQPLAKKEISTEQKPIVVQQLSVMPYRRERFDLTKWRNATISAEAIIPRRNILYDLYNDVFTTDAQVIAVWQKRVDAITSADWQFTDEEEKPIDEINQLIDCIGFENLLTAIIKSKAWGYTMVETKFFINKNDQKEFSIFEVPAKNMRPEIGVIAYNQLDNEGINIREGIYAKTIMEFGNPKDLGLLLSASMYSILKRDNISDWAEFIEVFGKGIIDATWDGYDDKQRKALSDTLANIGGGGVIVRPDGTTVTVHQTGHQANGQLQDNFASKLDDYISRALLGTTETAGSSKTSGYAQASVHQDQDEKKNDTDLAFVRRYLNTAFIPILKAAGFDTKNGSFNIKQKRTVDKTNFEIHKEMANVLNIPIDDDFFYKEYGVPKPDNYDELKKAQQDAKTATIDTNNVSKKETTPPPTEGKKVQTPKKNKQKTPLKLSLIKQFLRLFTLPPATATGATTTNYGFHLTKINLADFTTKDFEKLKESLIKQAWESKGNLDFSPDLFIFTAQTLINGLQKGWQKKEIKLMDVGFTYNAESSVIVNAEEMNLFRFSGVKTLYQAQRMNEIFRNTNNFREFYKEASQFLEVTNKTYLETEWEMAIKIGFLAARVDGLLKVTSVYPYWIYTTRGDDKVRAEHELLNGVTLPFDHPAWDKIMPPKGWNCRCEIRSAGRSDVKNVDFKKMEERVAVYLASEEYQKAKKQGFGVNRVKRGTVFTENQFYAKNLLDVEKQLSEVSYQQYGLKDFTNTLKETKTEPFKPTFGGKQRDEAVADFLTKIKPESDGALTLVDYKNRKIAITERVVNFYTDTTKNQFVNNHLFLSELENVLKTPNEVWLNNYTSSDMQHYTYIKYYNDFAVAIFVRLKDNFTLEVEGWLPVNNDSTRRGLLIKTKK